MLDRDQELERLLTMREPYIEDGGFTERVVARLPAPRAGRRYRMFILLGLGLLGFLVSFVAFPGMEYLTGSIAELMRYRPSAEIPVAAALVVAAMAAGAALVAAWSES